MAFSKSSFIETFLMKFGDKQSLFIRNMINKNYEIAKKIALELYSKNPEFLLFYSYFSLPESKTILLKVLKYNTEIDLNLTYNIIKDRRFSYEEIQDLTKDLKNISFINLLIKKALFLKKYEEAHVNLYYIETNANSSDINDVNSPQKIKGEIQKEHPSPDSASASDSNDKDIESSIEKNKANGSFQNTHLFDEENTFENQIIFEDFGENFIRSKKYLNILNSNVSKNKFREDAKESIKEELEMLLEELDDFELYYFALKHDFNIRVRDTINYMWYSVIKDKCKISAKKLILSSLSFVDIHRAAHLSNTTHIGSMIHDIAIDFLSNGYRKDLLKNVSEYFVDNIDFFTLKVFLALLIASKQLENLILAYYLSLKYKFRNNYEIDLIHLFLCRYFCFFNRIEEMFKMLDIKNIQIYNLSYVWSDPMIATSKFISKFVKMFKLHQENDISMIESSLRRFISSGCINSAASMLNLFNKLNDLPVIKELEEKRLLCTEKKTMFSLLLGEECAYIFDKLIYSHSRKTEGCISTIFHIKEIPFDEKVFENEYIKIEDQNFIENFKKLADFH